MEQPVRPTPPPARVPDPPGDHGGGAGGAGGVLLVAAERPVQRDPLRAGGPRRLCRHPHRGGLRPPRQGVWGGQREAPSLHPGPGARLHRRGGGPPPRGGPAGHGPRRGPGAGGHRPHLLRHRQPRVGRRRCAPQLEELLTDYGVTVLSNEYVHAGAGGRPHRPGGGRRTPTATPTSPPWPSCWTRSGPSKGRCTPSS